MGSISPEASDKIDRLLAADTDNFVELVSIARLDPARSFRHKRLRRVNFARCNLHGFDFTGARFVDCDFSQATLAGAIFTDAVFEGCQPSTELVPTVLSEKGREARASPRANRRTARLSAPGTAPVVPLHDLIEAGVHFGHLAHRWNPRMKPYIFGVRNGIHILDLSQTVPLLARALEFVAGTVAAGGKVLFVGTKRNAQKPIAEAARACGQFHVNHRWLGGMLTNWKTISLSIRRLKRLEKQLAENRNGLTKKEVLQLMRERDKLALVLGGIRDMAGIPDVMIVIDATRESLAIKEANVLGIPVVAILDSDADPLSVAFPVPGNDDGIRAINLYCAVFAAAAQASHEAAAPAAEDAVAHYDWSSYHMQME